MEVVFILHKPQFPENIGSAARAIYTMGFGKLRLVQTQKHLHERSRSLACHAQNVLEQAETFDTLPDAIRDLDVVVGTTARERRDYCDYLTPSGLRDYIQSKQTHIQKVGMVFGCEESGLGNDELAFCDHLTTIPGNREYGVLNLAQAVMIYAYELQCFGQLVTHPGKRAPRKELSHRVFKEKMAHLFSTLDVNTQDLRVRRVLEKSSLLGDEDLRLIHYLRKKILFKVDRENFKRGM